MIRCTGVVVSRSASGYVVVWCLFLLTITSVLVSAESRRQNFSRDRNLSREYAAFLENQTAAIITRLNDCANESRQPTSPPVTRPNQKSTAFPEYPRIPDTTTSIELTEAICPTQSGTSASLRLFKAEQVNVPRGFLPWRYQNAMTGTTSSQVSIEIAAITSQSVAGRSIRSYYNKMSQDSKVSHNRKMELTVDTGIRLTIIVEKQ